MDCQTAQLKLQALIDKELDEREIADVVNHMESCYGCRGEYIEFLKLQKKLEGAAYPEPPKEWFESLEKSRPRRSFLRLGWFLLIGSYLALLGWALVQFFQSPGEEIFPKLMVGGMIGGGVLLLVITILDRRRESRTDRYERSVHR